MVTQSMDGVKYRLKTPHDLGCVRKNGTVFQAIDETGSGCICFGVSDGEKKYFIKIAGADTIEAEVSPETAVDDLKRAIQLYMKRKAFCRQISGLNSFRLKRNCVLLWPFFHFSKTSQIRDISAVISMTAA